MKKVIILILFVFLTTLLTGCTVVRIDTDNIDNTINVVLSKNNELYNRVGKGYKYYVPRGVTYIDTDEFNDKLYSNGNYYYLYIDAISYFYQKEMTWTENKEAYYSKAIETKDKKGYIEITELNGKYFVKFHYNYAEIQALVEKKDINEVVLKASYILSTVKFNHNIIELMLDDEYFTKKEEKYDIFETKEETDNYVKVVDEALDTEEDK